MNLGASTALETIGKAAVEFAPNATLVGATNRQIESDISSGTTKPTPQTELQVADSTKPPVVSDDREREIEAIFDLAKGEEIADENESNFSRELVDCVEKFGNQALVVIAPLLIYEKISTPIIHEALYYLGKIENTESYVYRLWILERSLKSSSPTVRDGAALGLANLGDRKALQHLQDAIKIEKIPQLKSNMALVLDYLTR